MIIVLIFFSMKGQFYRQMIGVSHTEDEVRAIAAAQEGYQNPPNEEGEITLRTGVPNDLFWQPYANEKEARYALFFTFLLIPDLNSYPFSPANSFFLSFLFLTFS